MRQGSRGGRPDTPVAVALRAAILVAVVLAVIQLSGSVAPVEFLGAGRDGQGSKIMVEDFGEDAVREGIPFDGQYLYVTARLLPDLDAITEEIDESRYRLVRILHPLLSSPGGSGNGVIALMQLWIVVGVGLLTWGLADILSRYGHRAGWAMATVPACVIALVLTTSEPLAFGLAVAGLALLDRSRLLPATALFALGGLTRESALTVAVAGAVLLWTRGRRGAAGLVLAGAVLPTAVWAAYVRTITVDSRIPLAPFGILQLPDRWVVDIAATVIALALIAISVAAWWDVPPLRWLALAFAAWLPLYEQYAFKAVGLPRLSLTSMALGIAGLLRWRSERRVASVALAT